MTFILSKLNKQIKKQTQINQRKLPAEIFIDTHLPQVSEQKAGTKKMCPESLGIRLVILDIIITTTHV